MPTTYIKREFYAVNNKNIGNLIFYCNQDKRMYIKEGDAGSLKPSVETNCRWKKTYPINIQQLKVFVAFNINKAQNVK